MAMRNNSIEISFSSNSNSLLPLNNHIGTSSQHHVPPQPPTTTKGKHPFTKRRCGRPPGSKNKPKPTSTTSQLVNSSARVIEVNVTPGSDIIESILDIAHQEHVSLIILNASGTIANATLCTSPRTTALRLHGPFTLLSLTGSYIYKNHYTLHPGATPPPPLSFGINLSTSQGQVFSGPVAGTVVAGDNVNILISTFTNPDIYKDIPEAKDEDNNDNNNNGKNIITTNPSGLLKFN